jgi:hypothetical protein
MVNPVSTGVTRWWCHSASRRLLTGYGTTARQRRLMPSGGSPAPQEMKERAAAIDELLARDD